MAGVGLEDCSRRESVVVVSSHRPLKLCSPEILRNQLKARESWEHNFDRIIYLGPHETALDGDKVTFIPWENFPRILHLVQACAEQGSWSAIVNADIIVKYIPLIQRKLSQAFAVAAISRRYEFEYGSKTASVVDNGLDFFAALPSVWKLIAEKIPLQYRIGHCLFDTWLLGFMSMHYGPWFWDITPCQAIFHPKHGDRRPIFNIDQSKGQEILSRVQWPASRLSLT